MKNNIRKNIILVGSHGTGKTTLLQAYQKNYGGYARDGISRPVHDWNKENIVSPYEEQRLINILTISNFENNMIIPDLMTTRSPLDCIVYSEVFGWPDLANNVFEYLKDLSKNNIDLNTFIWVYVPIRFDIEDDGVRYLDKKLQLDVDKCMLKYLKELNINYHTIESLSISDRVEELRKIKLFRVNGITY